MSWIVGPSDTRRYCMESRARFRVPSSKRPLLGSLEHYLRWDSINRSRLRRSDLRSICLEIIRVNSRNEGHLPIGGMRHSVAVKEGDLLVEGELFEDEIGAIFRGELGIHPRDGRSPGPRRDFLGQDFGREQRRSESSCEGSGENRRELNARICMGLRARSMLQRRAGWSQRRLEIADWQRYFVLRIGNGCVRAVVLLCCQVSIPSWGTVRSRAASARILVFAPSSDCGECIEARDL